MTIKDLLQHIGSNLRQWLENVFDQFCGVGSSGEWTQAVGV